MKGNKFANFVVKSRYWLLGIFFVALVACGVLMNFVKVNYDLTEYLPDNSDTKESIQLMKEQFGASGTASIMVSHITQSDADSYAEKIQALDSVSTAVVSRYQDKASDGVSYALISVFLVNGDYTTEAEQALKDIEAIFNGEGGLTGEQHYYITGSAQSAVNSRTSIMGEIPIILLVAVLVVLAVLFVTTRSWIEPLILLLVIGTAIFINMGTNYFLGSISFVSNSISSVLLIALAMDYSIVLINRFREEREKESDIYVAMRNTIKGSFVTIIASGCTVMAGLASLMIMNYKIGLDMGLVLTKGVFISLLAVIFLMPAILLLFSKLIKKTEHKNFLKGLKHIGTFAKKTKWVMPIVFLCLICGAFAVQSAALNFNYMAEEKQSGTLYENQQKVNDVFGEQNSLVVILKTKLKDDKILLTESEQQYIFEYLENIEVDGNKLINSSGSFMSSKGEVQIPQAIGEYTETIRLGDKLDQEYISNYFTGSNEVFDNINQMIINDAGGDIQGIYVYKAIEYYGIQDNKDAEIVKINQIIDTYITDATQNAQAKYLYNTLLKTVADKYDKVMLAERVYNSQNVAQVSEKEIYTRMIFNINAGAESQEALSYINQAREFLTDFANNHPNVTFNIVSNSENVLETQDVFKTDRLKVELFSALAVLIICMISFGSISLPVLLVLVIEGAIWINLAGSAIIGNSIFFICYLLGTAIQMGATIDYGILLVDRYKEARKTQDKYTAIKTAIDKSFATILSSGTILVLSAFSIGIFSSTPLISSIGYLIGFGALCASLTILFVLPQILLLLDKLIAKSTLKSRFVFDKEENKQAKKEEPKKVVETTAKKVDEKSNK